MTNIVVVAEADVICIVAMVVQADVICIVYDVTNPETIEKVSLNSLLDMYLIMS